MIYFVFSFLSFFIIIINDVHAFMGSNCAIMGPKSIGIFGSLKDGHIGTFVFDRLLSDARLSETETQTLNFLGCNNASPKYLTLALAPDEVSIRGGSTSQHYTGDLSDDGCYIRNSPFAINNDFQLRNKFYKERTKFLRTCLEMILIDTQEGPIDYPEEQTQCVITRISPSKIKMQGGVCYIAIQAFNQFSLEFKFNKECTKENFLNSNNLHPIQMAATMNTFISGDASGFSSDLVSVDSTNINLLIESTDILPLSPDLGPGMPRFPSAWTADLHLGELGLELSNSGGNDVFLDVPIFVNNFADDLCNKNGTCFNVSNYSIPVVGEIDLWEMSSNNHKKNLIANLTKGTIIPARWQGEMNLSSSKSGLYIGDGLKENTDYLLEVSFSDPYDDYSLFIRKFKDLITLIPSIDANQSPAGGLGSLGGLGGMRNQFQDLSPLQGFNRPNLNFSENEIIESFKEALKSMGGNGGDGVWPPYYEKVCNKTMEKCVRSSNSGVHTRLSAVFRVKKVPADPAVKESSAKLVFTSLKIKKESLLGGNYELYADRGLAKVICKAGKIWRAQSK